MTEIDRRIRQWHPLALKVARRAYDRATVRAGVPLEDLEAEAICVLWKALKDYRPDTGYQLQAFLVCRINQRLCDYLRAHGVWTRRGNQRRASLQLSQLKAEQAERIDQFGGVDPSLTRVDLRDEVESELKFLPPRMRHLVRLIYLDGLSQCEAAVCLGVHGSRVSQMIRNLREWNVRRQQA